MIPLNVLVCPTLSSDPTTAFDVSADMNAIVLGATSGRVYAYKMNHVQKQQSLSLPPKLVRSKFSIDKSKVGPVLSVHLGSNTQQPLRFDCSENFHLVSDNDRIETKFVQCSVCQLAVTEVPVEHSKDKDVYCMYCSPAREAVDGVRTDVYASHPFRSSLENRTSETVYITGSDTKDANSTLLVKAIPTEWKCKVLCERADEGVRSIYIVPLHMTNIPASSYIKPGTVCMTLGDIMVRLAVSLNSQQCLNMKFQRRHYMDLCEETVVLQHGTKSILLTPGDKVNCVMLDCSIQKQFTLSQLDVPADAIPFAFTEKYLSWFQLEREKDLVQVFSIATVEHQKTQYHCHQSSQKRVTISRISGDRLVCVIAGSVVEVRNFTPTEQVQAVLSKYSPEPCDTVVYTEADFLTAVGEMYTPGLTPEEVKSLRSSDKHVWSPIGYNIPGEKHSYSEPAAHLQSVSKSLRCVKFTGHERGTIVALLAENNGEDIITLGTDMKMKFWHKGIQVIKCVNLKGAFYLKTPVVMHRVGRAVYYTSDEGIYAVVCPVNIEDENGVLDLGQLLLS